MKGKPKKTTAIYFRCSDELVKVIDICRGDRSIADYLEALVEYDASTLNYRVRTDHFELVEKLHSHSDLFGKYSKRKRKNETRSV